MTDSRNRLQAFLDDAMARTPVELASPLDQSEIVRRLAAAIDSEWAVFGSKPVVGRVGRDAFRLRRRIRYRNSFQTFLFGTMSADGRSTRLKCRVGMHPIVAALMAAWLFAVGGLLIGFLASASDMGRLLWVPVAMVAFGAGVVWLGRRLARDERRQLVEFLEQTIDAKAARY